MSTRPSLPELETLIAQKRPGQALDMMVALLQAIDERYGRLENVDLSDMNRQTTDEEIGLTWCTRFAAAIGALLADPELAFTPLNYERLLIHHRWIDLIFSVSGFRTSDHIFPRLASVRDNDRMTLEGTNFLRLLAILSLDSRLNVDLEQFWCANRVGAALAFLQYISSRYVFTRRAFEFRERLLEWLPDRLDEVKLGSMVLARLPEIYMHCSYAITPKKHAIKAALMRQMRRACLEAGAAEGPSLLPARIPERPTLFVICEHFVLGHSMYRTHSLAVRSLRERFHVVGVVYRQQRSPQIDDLFDEVMSFPDTEFLEGVRFLAGEIVKREAVLVFFPSVGMTPHAIALASLRLAPIQCASYGHAASTMSPAIDFMVLPEDFMGSRDRFSEKVMALPIAAMPFRPRGAMPSEAERRAVPQRTADAPIRVAIPASTMKLNPRYFDALSRIAAGAKRAVEFHFFPLASTGLAYLELKRIVGMCLPEGKVFAEAPHDTYIGMLRVCDFFLCPFPYGNTNSIVDSLQVGLPGVCLDGPEPHAHIDAGLFARIGFPEETVTRTQDQYVDAAIRMIDDAQWRAQCRDIAVNCDITRAFFTGDARLFCDAIAGLVWGGENLPGREMADAHPAFLP
jgi:HMW1C N-terminal/HMW1 domain 2